ncbi:MAG TPA: ATP-binding protein [Dissulfurispiraceae bacterium]
MHRILQEIVRRKLHSLTGKLILAIGSMMLTVGLIFSYIFITQNPAIKLKEVLFYGGSFVFVISFWLCLILYNIVTKPLSFLVDGMNKLSKGDMEYRINLHTKDEIGLLASSFNSMAEELMQYKEKMENWTRNLEEEVEKKTAEIYKAQEQLINTEKLASLGRMAAGVAHEINSPLTGIVTFAHLMLKRTPADNPQDIEDLNVIIDQAERCSRIIKGLLGFSRKTASEKIRVDINVLIENILSMVRNQAKFYNINFDVRLDRALPEISIDAAQIQQVFVNLLLNAADAMEEKGRITILSRLLEEAGGKFVELEFSDTGPGIPDDHLGKIFEPFFTTKPVGKGTGLGLAVSYGIIKKHEGQISVKSEAGKGASFMIRLPVA